MKRLTTKNMVLSAMFVTLIIAGAFIKIPIPMLPITLQTLFTLLAGLLLGRRLGSISVAVYLLLGLLGLPVFTEGGGIFYVLKPSFGYIIGFIAGAYLAGWMVEGEEVPSYKRLLAASFCGLGVIYVIGMIYYAFISNLYLGKAIGLKSLFLYCFLLVVPGDIVLCFLGAFVAKRLIPILRSIRLR